MIIGKHLSRRTVLRGLGVSVALPLLDAMTPVFAASTSKAAAKAPCRMLFTYLPNGIMMKDWTPATEGAGFELPRLLQPLAAYRDRMLVISGLTQYHGWPNGDGTGDHARAASTYLTGVHAKKTAGSDIQVGISVDQVAAQEIGKLTRIPSLELPCEDARMVGVCDSGYSCVYSNNISWRSAATPNAPEVNPRAVFERLFGSTDEDPATRAQSRLSDRSILDWVLDDSSRLARDLGPSDRRKLDEYLTAVREIEVRLQKTGNEKTEAVPSVEKPAETPAELSDHAQFMFDMLRIALQTDATRIATFMIGREGSLRTYREIGVPDSHHPLTHHGGKPDIIEKVYKINRFHMDLFAGFVAKLAQTPDGDGSLLDHVMIVYGGGISDGWHHVHDDLPVLVVGGGCGTIRGGRHVRVKAKTPMNNLYLSMLDRMGIPIEKLGDSTGKMQELSELS